MSAWCLFLYLIPFILSLFHGYISSPFVMAMYCIVYLIQCSQRAPGYQLLGRFPRFWSEATACLRGLGNERPSISEALLRNRGLIGGTRNKEVWYRWMNNRLIIIQNVVQLVRKKSEK